MDRPVAHGNARALPRRGITGKRVGQIVSHPNLIRNVRDHIISKITAPVRKPAIQAKVEKLARDYDLGLRHDPTLVDGTFLQISRFSLKWSGFSEQVCGEAKVYRV